MRYRSVIDRLSQVDSDDVNFLFLFQDAVNGPISADPIPAETTEVRTGENGIPRVYVWKPVEVIEYDPCGFGIAVRNLGKSLLGLSSIKDAEQAYPAFAFRKTRRSTSSAEYIWPSASCSKPRLMDSASSIAFMRCRRPSIMISSSREAFLRWCFWQKRSKALRTLTFNFVEKVLAIVVIPLLGRLLNILDKVKFFLSFSFFNPLTSKSLRTESRCRLGVALC